MARQSYSDQQVEQRREEILEAALNLFETGGIEAVSFRKVAAELGCSYSAPYRYFPSKDALLTAMRAHAFRWIEGVLNAALREDIAAEDRLQRLAETFVKAALDRPQRYALMFFRLQESDSGPRSEELATARRDALSVCTRTVAEAQARGAMTPALDPLTISHLFWAATHGLIALEVAGQFTLGRSASELLPQMIRAMLQGVGTEHGVALPSRPAPKH